MRHAEPPRPVGDRAGRIGLRLDLELRLHSDDAEATQLAENLAGERDVGGVRWGVAARAAGDGVGDTRAYRNGS
jgi:hypothetical protein